MGISIEMQLIKRGAQKNALRKQLQNDGYSSNQSIGVIQQLDIKLTETGNNDTSFEIKLDMFFLKNGMKTLFNKDKIIQFLIERERRQAESIKLQIKDKDLQIKESKQETESIKLQIKDKDLQIKESKQKTENIKLQIMKMRDVKIQEYKNKDKNLSDENAVKKVNAYYGVV